jgi:Ca2+-binding RTX toxin-like protein
MLRLCRSALLAALVLGAAPAAAQAADAWTAGATLNFVALEGEANALTVTLAGGTYTLTDGGAPVTAGAGCAQVTASEVTCPAAGITALSLDGRDRDDAVTVGPGTAGATLIGGAGDDVLSGGDGADVIFAGSGDNVAFGGAGDDILRGEEGDDVLDGGAGDDILIGNAGDDVLLNGEVVFDE